MFGPIYTSIIKSIIVKMAPRRIVLVRVNLVFEAAFAGVVEAEIGSCNFEHGLSGVRLG